MGPGRVCPRPVRIVFYGFVTEVNTMDNWFLTELVVWRLAGAAVWQAAFFGAAFVAWAPGALLSECRKSAGCLTTYFLEFAFLYALQFGVLFAHRMNLSASEAMFTSPIPQIGLHGRSWPAAFLSRVLLRGRKVQDLIGVASLLGATSFTAMTWLITYTKLHSSTAPSMAFCSGLGVILGLVYTLQHFTRCRDVLAFPAVHRHRYFQLRQRVPQLLLSALRVAALGLLVTLAAGYRTPGGLAALLAALHAACLCTFGWVLGQACLEVVFTEPMRLATRTGAALAAAAGEPDVTCLRTLLEAMGSSNAVVQDLALQEAVLHAEGSAGVDAAVRAAVFVDETGRSGWSPLAGYLLAELRDWVGQVAAALPTISGEAAAAARGSSGAEARVQWNVLSAASSTSGMRAVSKEQDMAAWVVRARGQRMALVMRALAALAAAAKAEDRYGCVLLCTPGLGDVLSGLLSACMALQQYAKLTSTLTSRSTSSLGRALQRVLLLAGPTPHPSLQQSEYCAHTLEDTARRCTYLVVGAFGPSLKSAMAEARMKPAFGSAADLSAQLASFLAYQE